MSESSQYLLRELTGQHRMMCPLFTTFTTWHNTRTAQQQFITNHKSLQNISVAFVKNLIVFHNDCMCTGSICYIFQINSIYNKLNESESSFLNKFLMSFSSSAHLFYNKDKHNRFIGNISSLLFLFSCS